MLKKTKNIGFITMLFLFFLANPALANTPTIISGTKNLLDAALGWVLILIPAGAACMLAYHAFSKSMSEGDPAKTESHNRAMKNILIASAIGITAAGTIKAVLSFYGG